MLLDLKLHGLITAALLEGLDGALHLGGMRRDPVNDADNDGDIESADAGDNQAALLAIQANEDAVVDSGGNERGDGGDDGSAGDEAQRRRLVGGLLGGVGEHGVFDEGSGVEERDHDVVAERSSRGGELVADGAMERIRLTDLGDTENDHQGDQCQVRQEQSQVNEIHGRAKTRGFGHGNDIDLVTIIRFVSAHATRTGLILHTFSIK